MNSPVVRGVAALALIAGGSACFASEPRPDRAASDLEPPVRLKVEGQVIDTGAAWGHSSPAVTDLNADGKADLVVGDFSGKLRRYLNVGSREAPAYVDDGLIQAGGEDAHVKIYCCIGAQPRFHDFDGDGLRDILVNSYDPGHAYLFRARPGNKFASRMELLDESGTPVRSSPVQKQTYQSFGSFYEAVDWDDDGDFDLLIGCFTGELRLRVNNGTARSLAFASENIDVLAGDAPLKVKAHLCPVVADWDGDGLWDVIAGSDDGSVAWFRNTGRTGAPAFAAGRTLVEKHDGNGYRLALWEVGDVVPGIRTQPEVTDFNGDGKLDLLVGDFYTAYDFKPDLTEEQKRRANELLAACQPSVSAMVAKRDTLLKDFGERYPGDASVDDKVQAEWAAAVKALREGPEGKALEQAEKLLVRDLPPFLATTRGFTHADELTVPHGHVWLFTRK